MKFRNYCIVVMDNIEGVKDEIMKISENQARYLDAKGIIISTFSSIAEPSELKDYFKDKNRSFFIFDLDEKSSGYNINKEHLHNHLFGFLMDKSNDLEDMTNKLMEEIKSTSNNDYSGSTVMNKIDKIVKKEEVDIDGLSPNERVILLNEILDKGSDNLSNEDKELLNKLSKK